MLDEHACFICGCVGPERCSPECVPVYPSLCSACLRTHPNLVWEVLTALGYTPDLIALWGLGFEDLARLGAWAARMVRSDSTEWMPDTLVRKTWATRRLVCGE